MKTTKEEFSWILYDCGNSAYSMVVTTALLPIFFGMFNGVNNSMDLGYYNSFASILIAIFSPILGTIADYKDFKKRFFIFFSFLGIIMTLFLGAITPQSGNWQLLVFFYIMSAVGFAGANIFYDSFLVDVTSDKRMDIISTRGFAYGYIVSVLPFAICIALIFLFGFDNPIGYQIGFLLTALWWGLLTFPMIRYVNQIHFIAPEPTPIQNSFKRLNETFRNIKKQKVVFTFLIAYFFYIDGVDTIIKMVVPYSSEVLGEEVFDAFSLIAIFLVVQIIAFPCAIIYGKLAEKFSTKIMIVIGILTYILVCILGYFINNISHIFILGILVGSAQGGVQALSRSYFAKIIPKENSNEFFGFYNIFGKFAAIVGPLIMSLTTTITGNARFSIFAVIPLFIIGLVILLSINEKIER